MNENRPDAASSDDGALFAVDELPAKPVEPGHAGRPRRGRHEKALAKALRDAGLTGRKHAASTSLAHGYARALDAAERRDNFYAIAQVGPRYHELLTSLGLIDEGVRGAGDDDEQGILDGMGTAEVVNIRDAG